MRTTNRTYSRDAAGLAPARPTQVVTLSDGERFDLQIAPVAKRIGDALVRMLAYNGSIPGPTLRVKQGSEVVVHVTNRGDVDATVHWHGLRLENRFDGVPHETQTPIPVGGSFTYRVRFPDEGLYWYHPHVREDYTQDMGLYGNILVEPTEPSYWPPADREAILTVDDLLMEEGQIAPYGRSGPNHAAMGRYGNVLLVNGEPEWSMEVRRGEVVRLYLTNTANARVFNLAIPGAAMKLVGGDSGRVEREVFVEEVLISPSERAVVDVLFERPGEFLLEHRPPGRSSVLGRIQVTDPGAERSSAGSFASLRRSPELMAERERIAGDLEREPDKVLALVAEMDMGTPGATERQVYVCPMHPEVLRDEPGRCPKCGMALVPQAAAGPTPGDGGHEMPGGHEMHGGGAGGIEWEDTMRELNRATNPGNMRWMLVDRETGRRNSEIDWSFEVGDRVKIRLVNEMDSDHPMQHPFHIHGAGRFLVLARDGDPETNLVWKDTVLVRTGQIVDVLLDVSNPGLWMAHCHIAEHTESGMMFSFRVARRP